VIDAGIHHISATEYHAGVDAIPRLSASIANLLVTSSPAHAWWHHPVLNPNYVPTEDAKYDVGSVAHAILLDGHDFDDIVVSVDADDWRTKAAREERDAARAAGHVPLLLKQRAEVLALVDAVRTQLADHEADPTPLTDGVPEATLLWEEAGVHLKARVDWLRTDNAAVDDLKTTTRSAAPAAYARALFNIGGDIQAAMYVRAVQQLTGAVPDFRWIVVESSPPYALSVLSPDPGVLELGRRKVDWAIAKWRQCLAADEWPAYAKRVAYVEPPAWEESRWLETELAE
jgi:PDDEXK-like domain of unknown function (DUF3799)